MKNLLFKARHLLSYKRRINYNEIIKKYEDYDLNEFLLGHSLDVSRRSFEWMKRIFNINFDKDIEEHFIHNLANMIAATIRKIKENTGRKKAEKEIKKLNKAIEFSEIEFSRIKKGKISQLNNYIKKLEEKNENKSKAIEEIKKRIFHEIENIKTRKSKYAEADLFLQLFQLKLIETNMI